MDVENILPQSEQQYVNLLGKRYPVIQCNNNVDLASSIDNSTIPGISNSTNFSNTANNTGETMLTSTEQTASGGDQVILLDQVIQLSNGQSASETIMEDESYNLADQIEPTQDNSVSAEPVNEAVDEVSADEAIALALSLNQETEPSSFQYEVNTTSNSDETAQVANSSLEQTPSTAESSEDAAGMNPTPNDVEETTPIQSSGTATDTLDSSGDSTVVPTVSSIVSNAENNSSQTPSGVDAANVPSDDSGPTFSVSSKHNILDYAQSEWKGSTYTAKCLRNGYQMLITNTGSNFMRQIRGDNYCALRATAFQILSQNTSILSSHPDWKQYVKTVATRLLDDYKCDWLCNWTFADRLDSTPDNRYNVMQECLDFLIEQKELSNAMQKNDDRIAHFTALFNSGTNAEIKLFEAIKLLMLETAVVLHHLQARGEEVPIFAWLLFARDTSETPESLMINHLNPAGKTGGLEQVEMCLLGQALQLTLRVFRPSQVEQEDFVSHYPDHMLDVWKQVDLIAEDDRHYNIIVN